MEEQWLDENQAQEKSKELFRIIRSKVSRFMTIIHENSEPTPMDWILNPVIRSWRFDIRQWQKQDQLEERWGPIPEVPLYHGSADRFHPQHRQRSRAVAGSIAIICNQWNRNHRYQSRYPHQHIQTGRRLQWGIDGLLIFERSSKYVARGGQDVAA